MPIMRSTPWITALAMISWAISPATAQITPQQLPAAMAGPSYADLADLADSSDLVVKVQLRRLTRVENERAPGLRPGWGRFYVEARTQALLLGNSPLGESLTYLVDLPLDERGKPARLKNREALLFARPVRGRPSELQLIAPDAQELWTPAIEQQLRAILIELVAPDSPGRVTGVREMIHVPGNLAGEGETQIFLSSADRSPVSITVQHRPGRRPAWGVSFTELIADLDNPPRPDTLAWYRLACFLPNSPPRGANLSENPASRRQAEADYLMVLGELGTCRRTRR